jgi:hypothetical protein
VTHAASYLKFSVEYLQASFDDMVPGIEIQFRLSSVDLEFYLHKAIRACDDTEHPSINGHAVVECLSSPEPGFRRWWGTIRILPDVIVGKQNLTVRSVDSKLPSLHNNSLNVIRAPMVAVSANVVSAMHKPIDGQSRASSQSPYSVRNASIGTIFAARRAGSQLASKPVTASSTTTASVETASYGVPPGIMLTR